jgi:hypothetical protein
MIERTRWAAFAVAAITLLAAVGLTTGAAEARPKHWHGHHHVWHHQGHHYGWYRGHHHGWYRHHRPLHYGYGHRHFRHRPWG